MQEVPGHLSNVNDAWKSGLKFKIGQHLNNAATFFNKKPIYIHNLTGTDTNFYSLE